MKNFVQSGDTIAFVAGATTTSGQVVAIGNILAIACTDVANGATGEAKRTGVFTVPKVSAAVIANGESLTWDASAAAFDDNAATPATGDITGPACHAAEAAGNGVTSMKVMFTGVPGTKT